MRKNGEGSKGPKDGALRIAGEILPESLVTAISEYRVTEFSTKTNEELLGMLVNPNLVEDLPGKIQD